MNGAIRYRGKIFDPGEIDEIREVIGAHRGRSRWFISGELCRRWGWTQANGVLKDIISRGLLLHLEARGFIELPPRSRQALLLERPGQSVECGRPGLSFGRKGIGLLLSEHGDI